MKTYTFTKSYTRETTIVLEEGWFFAQTKGMEKFIGKNPYGFPNVYYMRNGLVEIWENKMAIGWIMEKIAEKLERDKKFLERTSKQYLKLYKKIEKKWKKSPAKTKQELSDFIHLFLEAVPCFAVIFFLAINFKVPKAQRKLVLKIREKDKLFNNSNNYVASSIRQIFPQLKGLEYAILFREIRNGFRVGELKKRYKNWVLVPGKINQVAALGTVARRHKSFLFEKENTEEISIRQITGQIAFKGKARGKVKIIRMKQEIADFRKGDILVSSMTIPDFVPAMKKAAAIITDEGGITCHAAIISRELKKPCIIGTKVATKILKDGDAVEVDADNGIVRIIKKS